MGVPRGSANFEESDELQRLRRRAYGPDADIAGDAAAQARLSELEAAERRERAAGVGAGAAPRAPVSERVPVPVPPEGSRPAWRSVSEPVDGASPSMSLTEGRSPSTTPPGCRSPIPGRATGPPRHRGGAAAAYCHGSSPRRRCWPRPYIGIGIVVSSSSMSRPARTARRPPPEHAVAQLTPQGQPGSASIPRASDRIGVGFSIRSVGPSPECRPLSARYPRPPAVRRAWRAMVSSTGSVVRRPG